jgi:hypothetical protein
VCDRKWKCPNLKYHPDVCLDRLREFMNSILYSEKFVTMYSFYLAGGLAHCKTFSLKGQDF